MCLNRKLIKNEKDVQRQTVENTTTSWVFHYFVNVREHTNSHGTNTTVIITYRDN